MPRLAPNRHLPKIGALTRAALARKIDVGEVRREVDRQLASFEAGAGFAPDFIDGHQHVHALPGIRDGVLAALRHRFAGSGPLVRSPGDQIPALVARGLAVPKAVALAGLAFGFAAAARRAGFLTNDTFSGVTDFRPEAASDELRQAMLRPGAIHLVMCHPGHPDAELALIDPVTSRRRTELDALMNEPELTASIWRPSRASNGPVVDWSRITDEQ